MYTNRHKPKVCPNCGINLKDNVAKGPKPLVRTVQYCVFIYNFGGTNVALVSPFINSCHDGWQYVQERRAEDITIGTICRKEEGMRMGSVCRTMGRICRNRTQGYDMGQVCTGCECTEYNGGCSM